ncbi:hypothetical protein KDL44_02335 [bacterium]|nr:hypothetical protein [bacterium]
MRTTLRIEKLDQQASTLLDDPQNPRAMLLVQGGMLCAAGDPAAYQGMLADLLAGRVQSESGWPAIHLRKSLEWMNQREERCVLFLNTAPLEAYEAALSSGWQANEDGEDSPPAYLFHFHGEPRFAELVLHSCRLGEGLELHELMRQGISYDQEGHYTRICLENGPSFVCEVDGVPVCWSCTHMNGTMGMIYTPEEHRRRGYARSLAAFQIDHMLNAEGIACCHVVEGNTASEQMVLGMGAQRCDQPFCWRTVVWPNDRLPELNSGG